MIPHELFRTLLILCLDQHLSSKGSISHLAACIGLLSTNVNKHFWPIQVQKLKEGRGTLSALKERKSLLLHLFVKIG